MDPRTTFGVFGTSDPSDQDHLVIEPVVYPLSYFAKKTIVMNS